jgi:hypothetical protein
MRAKPLKQDTTTAHPPAVANGYVREALAKQAESRPARTPPKLMADFILSNVEPILVE